MSNQVGESGKFCKTNHSPQIVLQNALVETVTNSPFFPFENQCVHSEMVLTGVCCTSAWCEVGVQIWKMMSFVRAKVSE